MVAVAGPESAPVVDVAGPASAPEADVVGPPFDPEREVSRPESAADDVSSIRAEGGIAIDVSVPLDVPASTTPTADAVVAWQHRADMASQKVEDKIKEHARLLDARDAQLKRENERLEALTNADLSQAKISSLHDAEWTTVLPKGRAQTPSLERSFIEVADHSQVGQSFPAFDGSSVLQDDPSQGLENYKPLLLGTG